MVHFVKGDFFDRLSKSDTFSSADLKGKVQRMEEEPQNNQDGTKKTTVSN
jgi:hypothetical protein